MSIKMKFDWLVIKAPVCEDGRFVMAVALNYVAVTCRSYNAQLFAGRCLNTIIPA